MTKRTRLPEPKYAFSNFSQKGKEKFDQSNEEVSQLTKDIENVRKEEPESKIEFNKNSEFTRITFPIPSKVDQKLEFAALALRKKKGILVAELLMEGLKNLNINFPF